jgi:hypothetical protein
MNADTNDLEREPDALDPVRDRVRIHRIQAAWDAELRRQERASHRLLDERLAARESTWSI